MKKIFLILIGIISGLFIGIKGVNALVNDSTLTTQYIDGVYSYRYRNGVLISYGKLPYRYQNGNLAYCIDSSTVIGTYTYSSTDDWSVSGYTNEEKTRMELISYYGYGYEGHDSIKYYMATQELIWLFRDDVVKWTVDYDENSTQINVDNEKKEILRLVNQHYIVPSFVDIGGFNQDFGSTFLLIDTNNVLENYNIITELPFTKEKSKLRINPNKFGLHKVKLVHKRTVPKNTKLYYSSGIASQKMAIFGLNDINASFDVVINEVFVKINKKDSETKDIIEEKNVTFGVKKEGSNTYIKDNIKTNVYGYAGIQLPQGTYEIEEIKAPYGYVVNKENIVITVDENMPITDGAYQIDIYNEKPVGAIKINKVDEQSNKIPGVLIGLYDENYNLIDSLTTSLSDDMFENLKLGTYYVKELDTIYGYLIDDNFYKVELKYKDDRTYIVEEQLDLINKKIKCDIVYITSSEEKPLSNVEINVYDSNDKLVFNGKTDKKGKVTITSLAYGTYYIKQVKVPKGYIISSDSYKFYVNDSTCIGSINVKNDKTVMPVTTASLNMSLFISLILSAFGIYNFVKKNY